ncbi:hypothetical protein VTO73DRAFT_4380 [Trametes versicolor]
MPSPVSPTKAELKNALGTLKTAKPAPLGVANIPASNNLVTVTQNALGLYLTSKTAEGTGILKRGKKAEGKHSNQLRVWTALASLPQPPLQAMKMRFSLIAIAIPIAMASALEITAPSESVFWVQDTSNTITWTFNEGDPSPLTIVLRNADPRILNGVGLAIASSVDTSAESFTVANVTLPAASGYTVEFDDPLNNSKIFASSAPFMIKPPGSAPPPL